MTEEIYPGNELELFAYASNWKAYCRKALSDFIKGNVLEVGAGLGSNTTGLADTGINSWTSLEPDPRLAAGISDKIRSGELDERYKLVVGKLTDLSTNDKYDTILYLDVLEHIENDAGELEYASRLLNKTGYFVILSPAHNWLFTEFDKSIGHYRRYDRKSLTRIIPEGFENVRLSYMDSVGMLASLANKLILHSELPSKSQIIFWDRMMVRASRYIDPLLRYSFGRTILGIWRKAID